MAKWILKRAGKNSAPIEHIKMIELAKLGRLMPTDLVALEGSDNWVAGDKFADFVGRQQAPGQQTLLDLPTAPVTPVVNLADLAEDDLTAGLPMRAPFQDEIKKQEIARRWRLKKIALGAGALVLMVGLVVTVRYAVARHEAAGFAVQSRDNLKDIGVALRRYAQDHDDLYPHTLGVLVREKLLSSRQLLNPAGARALPLTFDPGELSRWIDQNGDYGFTAGDAPSTSLHPQTIVVYERWPENSGAPVQVLTAGGPSTLVASEEAEGLIRASRTHAWQMAQAAKTRSAANNPGAGAPGSPPSITKTGP